MLYKAQEVVVQSVVKTSVFEFLTSTVERNYYCRRGEERRGEERRGEERRGGSVAGTKD